MWPDDRHLSTDDLTDDDEGDTDNEDDEDKLGYKLASGLASYESSPFISVIANHERDK